jgi:hypothetical protein
LARKVLRARAGARGAAGCSLYGVWLKRCPFCHSSCSPARIRGRSRELVPRVNCGSTEEGRKGALVRALWARSNTTIPYITLVITSLAVERAAARHQPFHREDGLCFILSFSSRLGAKTVGRPQQCGRCLLPASRRLACPPYAPPLAPRRHSTSRAHRGARTRAPHSAVRGAQAEECSHTSTLEPVAHAKERSRASAVGTF